MSKDNLSEQPPTRISLLDASICRIEKFIAAILFLMMALVVLTDVIHRVFSRTPGRIASIFATPFHSTPEALDPMVNRFVIPIILFGFVYAAVRSRSTTLGKIQSTAQVLVKSLLGSVLIAALVLGFIEVVPSGFMWSPYFGLSCLLWIGLLGASIATHHGQHLALEMGEKLWPKKIRPAIAKFSFFLTGSFCACIAVLAILSVKDHYVDWSSGPGAGLIPSIDWPKWLVYSVVPYSFLMMAFRFIAMSMGLLLPKKDGLL